MSAPSTFMLSGKRLASAIMYTLPSARSLPGALSPSISISPSSAQMRLVMRFIIVVLPAPFAPSRP